VGDIYFSVPFVASKEITKLLLFEVFLAQKIISKAVFSSDV